MLITKQTLFQDTVNFFHNQCTNIIFLILLSTGTEILLKYIFMPNNYMLLALNKIKNLNLQQMLKEISIDQQNTLLQILITNTTSNIISHILLVTGILTILHLTSNNKSLNILQFINFAKSIIFKLLPLIILIMLSIQLGLLLIIIPGILLTIAFSLAPILIINKKLSIAESLYLSAKLTCTYYDLIAPIILIGLTVKFFIILIINQFTLIPIVILQIFLNIFNHFITTLLLIYLYRFNMIIR
ncbi:YciC family protein [Blochmannia endosymbiont of Camponotus (Colobopsis) obliquus]|uniref:YciC family protein n=1 Tax=Blochmannia endosymbiont of Camponotus (Colobopsis) obliquus TaxID=1505597 RepID=UPI00061A8717|nr:YciC family protein [Blochmannia endosymbiont of Camponotus (Colobopsis) obliquus]AKC60585.1 membrane protein YciC [Blochmannia endosymbiont of Camponotus (Colobopsis) obliquus]